MRDLCIQQCNQVENVQSFWLLIKCIILYWICPALNDNFLWMKYALALRKYLLPCKFHHTLVAFSRVFVSEMFENKSMIAWVFFSLFWINCDHNPWDYNDLPRIFLWTFFGHLTFDYSAGIQLQNNIKTSFITWKINS